MSDRGGPSVPFFGGAIHRWIARIGRRRSKTLVDRIERYIDDHSKVLDIGPGGGWISEEIGRRKNADITGVDVTNFSQTKMHVDLYDGETLPYPDESFDTCLLIYTLHHCSTPRQVLGEAKRVCKKRLIIIEDTPHSTLSRIYAIVWDTLTNLPTYVIPPGMNMPLNFDSREGWRRVFSELGLEITVEEPFVSDKRMSKVVFVVDKRPNRDGTV